MEKTTQEQYNHSTYNVNDCKNSEACGCFYCIRFFDPTLITEYSDEGKTVVCPMCGIDAVLADSRVEMDINLLRKMNQEWFPGVNLTR